MWSGQFPDQSFPFPHFQMVIYILCLWFSFTVCIWICYLSSFVFSVTKFLLLPYSHLVIQIGSTPNPPLSYFLYILYFLKLILKGEEGESVLYDLFMHSLGASCMCLARDPPTTMANGDHVLTNWTTGSGFYYSFTHRLKAWALAPVFTLFLLHTPHFVT